MPQLYELGLWLFGGAIPVALVAGGYAWAWLAVCALLVLLLATAQDGGWTHRSASPRQDALRRPGDDEHVPLILEVRPRPDRLSGGEPR